MTGSFRTLKGVTCRALSAPCFVTFHESGLWFWCCFSKATDIAARQWLKQMADCDKPLLIGNKNTRSYTALCTNTWGYCRFLCISGFYFESGLIFSMHNPHRMSKHARCVSEASTAVCESQDFFFFNQPSKPYFSPLRFLTGCAWFGDRREKNFDLLIPSEILPNWMTNSPCIASLFPSEMLLMNKTMRKRRIEGGSSPLGRKSIPWAISPVKSWFWTYFA